MTETFRVSDSMWPAFVNVVCTIFHTEYIDRHCILLWDIAARRSISILFFVVAVFFSIILRNEFCIFDELWHSFTYFPIVGHRTSVFCSSWYLKSEQQYQKKNAFRLNDDDEDYMAKLKNWILKNMSKWNTIAIPVSFCVYYDYGIFAFIDNFNEKNIDSKFSHEKKMHNTNKTYKVIAIFM